MSTVRASRRIAVIGGGITGLATALSLSDGDAEVELFEASPQLGGKIAETHIDGRSIPTGPDAFLARRPEVAELAISLGLEDQLVRPSAGSARIFRNGRLHPLPPNVLGVPSTSDLTQTGLISAEGAARAEADLLAPDDRPEGDESVGDLVRRRLGDEVHEYLVDPLLGGINAGDSDRLSIESGVPQLAALRAKHPSLITAALETLAAAPANPSPVFQSIDGGLNRLIDRIESVLKDRSNVRLHLSSEATIARTAASWRVSNLDVDEVVITTPSFLTAELIRPFAPDAADALERIDYSSVGLTVLVLPAGTIDIDPAISGVLVPRACGLHVTAVSFASHKWPELAPRDEQILRVSVGRRTDQRWSMLSDAEVVQLIRNDLSEIFDTMIGEGPAVLTRWDNSLPQYDVNHRALMAELDQNLAQFSGLTVTGAWRGGLGLPACVASGETGSTSHRVNAAKQSFRCGVFPSVVWFTGSWR